MVPSTLPDPLLAHAGGVDEVLLVAVPIVIFLVLQWLSRRRTERNGAEAPPAPGARGDKKEG